MRYAPLLLLLLCSFCSSSAQGQGPWVFSRPDEARRTGAFEDPELTESSGVAVSRRHPGVLWTHNDGGQPMLFATDTAGTALARVKLTGAKVDDAEDIAVGPCGRGTCVYLADTGDNRERRRTVRLIRIPEPDLPARGESGRSRPAVSIELRYPDGPHDVEAMWVDPAGDTHLVTKGRTVGIRHYRVPASAWSRKGVAIAEAVGVLPIGADHRLDRFVTGAAISPDGRWVAVRTYREIYFFATGTDGTLALPPRPIACTLGGIDLQGEGVAWLDGSSLVLTSERAIRPRGTVAVVRCPLRSGPPVPAAGAAPASRNR
ncbi:MAG TPA: hypothetical protein VFU46_10295 [Gemmatimonadales bacterium]|nr:hypothetical protein [Gemmatimonadales bacterium]